MIHSIRRFREGLVPVGPLLVLLVGTLGILSGCARDQYYYGLKVNGTQQLAPRECSSTNPLAVGGYHPRVDRLERVMQAPRKFLQQKLAKQDRPAQHPGHLRYQAVKLSQEYLADNGLNDVRIDACRYEPAEQWQRLKENDRIAPFWKFTAGTLDVVGYTLLPRRALHSDNYSPFTNTLSINSTNACKALYQAARAKEYHKQRWPGTYAVLQQAPGAGMIHHAQAASDALTYARANEDRNLTRELYPIAYSQLGSAAISDVMFFAPLPTDASPLASPLIKLAGRSTGRLMGQLMARQQEPEASRQ